MTTVGKFVTLSESRLSKQTAAKDDAAANEEEVEEQIEADDVKKAARNNTAGVSMAMMSNADMAVDDDALSRTGLLECLFGYQDRLEEKKVRIDMWRAKQQRPKTSKT